MGQNKYSNEHRLCLLPDYSVIPLNKCVEKEMRPIAIQMHGGTFLSIFDFNLGHNFRYHELKKAIADKKSRWMLPSKEDFEGLSTTKARTAFNRILTKFNGDPLKGCYWTSREELDKRATSFDTRDNRFYVDDICSHWKGRLVYSFF